MNRYITFIFAVLLALVVISFGCTKSDHGAQSPPLETTVYDPIREVPENAKQESAPLIEQCRETYRYLYGEGGCLPGQMSPDRINAACAGYSAWEQQDDQCAVQSFDVFFACLRDVDCDVFDTEDGIGLGGHFSACRRRFAQDMDICLKAQKAEAQNN